MHYSMWLMFCLSYFLGILTTMIYSRIRLINKIKRSAPKLPAYKQKNRTGVMRIKQTNVHNNKEKQRQVDVLVEELGRTGKFSQIKVVGITGTEKEYHNRVKEIVGEFVDTGQIEWA